MNQWYCVEMGDGVDAREPTDRLFEAFMAFAAQPGAANVAVFSNYDLKRNAVSWWFSPEAVVLARSFGAEPCDKPKPSEGFGLLVGDERVWNTHFPDYIRSKRR